VYWCSNVSCWGSVGFGFVYVWYLVLCYVSRRIAFLLEFASALLVCNSFVFVVYVRDGYVCWLVGCVVLVGV
jgi:hypothetical protein